MSAAALAIRFANTWTPAEDAILREHYERRGIEPTAALVGRSPHAVAHRARDLGLSRRRRWTDPDDRRLQMLWGEVSVAQCAKLLNRTEATIFWRAQKLQLPLGVQPGMESPRAAARRTGFPWETLKAILAWAGVQAVRTMSRPIGKVRYRRRMVESLDVDEAIERWLACEAVNAAARRHGMAGETLSAWLTESGEILPPKPMGKRRWRVPSEVIDRVVAARREMETMPQAAARVGITRWTLSRYLDAAGIPRCGPRGRAVRPADVDRLVASLTSRQWSYVTRGRKGRGAAAPAEQRRSAK